MTPNGRDALDEEVDPFRLASRILRLRMWHNPAGYASLAMGCYRRYCDLSAQRPLSERDMLVALATRVFVGVHRRTVRRDIERADIAQAAKAATS